MTDRPTLTWPGLACMAADVGFLVYKYHRAMRATSLNAAFADPVYVPLLLSALYLAMIYGGRRWMRTRQPLHVRGPMLAYNLYQTTLNLWMVGAFLGEVYSSGMPVWGSGIDSSTVHGRRLGFLIYAHYHNKYVEYADTLFMVLRRKDDQISFLHVYHHALLPWSWYAVVRWAPGGDAWFGAYCNSLVHVFMYAYYLCAVLGDRCPWKRQLTQMQMGQFCLCFAHSVYVGYLGSDVYPRPLTALQAFVMLNMLFLFGNFYAKSYPTGG